VRFIHKHKENNCADKGRRIACRCWKLCRPNNGFFSD